MKKNADRIYLPITMAQFEELTNDILKRLNLLANPKRAEGFTGDYVAQVLTSAIHAMDHKSGRASKDALFSACVNRISNHITFEATQEIQRRLKSEAGIATSDDQDPGDPRALSAATEH